MTPTASLTLGAQRFDCHAAAVGVDLSLLPGVGRFMATLPAAAAPSAALGDEVSLDLDGGEGAETVLTGTLIQRHNSADARQVVGADAGALLAGRPAATFEGRDGAAVIRALAGDVGASVGTLDLDLPLAVYVAHAERTRAEHIAELAELGGALAFVNADGKLVVQPPGEGAADLALRYGRELLSYQAVTTPLPSAAPFVLGSGPAGSPDAPEALRPSFDRLPASAPKPGADARWRLALALKTPDAAATASGAAQAAAMRGTQRLSATCWLLPQLRPGLRVEVQDLPDGTSLGPWLITRVRHRLDPRAGATTVFHARGAGAGSGSLLGAALGALGGLL